MSALQSHTSEFHNVYPTGPDGATQVCKGVERPPPTEAGTEASERKKEGAHTLWRMP